MKTIIFTVAVLFTINFVSGQIIERKCDKDEDCDPSNHFICSSNINKCRCAAGFRQGNRQDCIKSLGSTCEANDECENLPDAECTNNQCTCKQGFQAGDITCNKVGNEGEECTDHSDCISRFTDENKECKANQCVCKSGLHNGHDKKCKPDKGLNEQCEADECFQADSQNNNALECIEVKENANSVKKCKCKEGYTEKGDKCNGGATKFILSISSLLLVALTVLKM